MLFDAKYDDMTIDEYMFGVDNGLYTPMDGYGEYLDGEGAPIGDADFELMRIMNAESEGAVYVRWYGY